VLEAHHLVKRFFGVAALNDVSFVVRPGEIVGYLGPNGSGKTMTARLLTGLLTPTSGTVSFRGQDIAADMVGYHRQLGYVPEEPHLYPFLSGREYLQLIGRLRELPAPLINKKIDAFLELLGIRDAAEQSISAYSKGMKQKVLVSAALLHDPDVIVFDEPESGLDVTAALVLRNLVRVLASRGKAILYSSHIMEIVEKVCSRVIILHRGRIVADGSVEYLRELQARSRTASGAGAGEGTLEQVFAELVLNVDPAVIAGDLADVAQLRA